MKGKKWSVRESLQLERNAVMSGEGRVEFAQTDSAAGSRQTVAADVTLGANAGTSEVGDTDFKAPFMGNVLGENLTKLYNYIAGKIGAYSITGTNASVYPKAGVLGMVNDGTTTADAPVVAHMDGGDPSTETHARAAFAVTVANNHASSSFEVGVDLKAPLPSALNDNLSGTAKQAVYTKCLLRSPNDVCVLEGDGAPTSGASGTGDNFAGKGSTYHDFTNANLYVQVGAITAPDWKLVTRAS